MGDWNLGSVSESVLDLVPNVPTSISGTRLLEIADRQREFVQNYTGTTIGSNSIGIDFQSPILNLAISQTTKLMNLVGGDAEEYKIDDFSYKKGTQNNLVTMGKTAREMAMEELKILGRKTNYYKANG